MSVNTEKNLKELSDNQQTEETFAVVQNDLRVDRPLYGMSKGLGIVLMVIFIIWRVVGLWGGVGGGGYAGSGRVIGGSKALEGTTWIKFDRKGCSGWYIWDHSKQYRQSSTPGVEIIVEEQQHGRITEVERSTGAIKGWYYNPFRLRVNPSLRKKIKFGLIEK